MRATLVSAVFILLFFGVSPVSAEQEFNLGSSLTGGNFRILDPQHGAFGATSSSSSPSFRLLGAIGDVAIGSSSASTYGLRSGFLYFPFILEPSLTSATPGNGQVSLVWTPAQAQAGLSIGGYNVCTKPSGGSYVCQNVGSVLAFLKTGLSNGTTYTFRIQAYDALSNVIAHSNELNSTPTGPGGGGGGGGGFLPSPSSTPSGGTSLELSGLAYPAAVVHILRDGIEIGTTVAGPDARFFFSVAGQPTGQRTIGLWAVDTSGRRSVTLAFVVTINSGATARILGIIVPPSIQVADTEIAVGALVNLIGSSGPNATVRAVLEPSGREAVVIAGPNGNGIYNATLSTSGLSAGVYSVKARTELLPGSDMSTWSQLVRIGVGVPLGPLLPDTGGVCRNGPDINRSGRVDLVDFSVMAFWWRKAISGTPAYDLNCDSQLTLADFSILAYHWTGR